MVHMDSGGGRFRDVSWAHMQGGMIESHMKT